MGDLPQRMGNCMSGLSISYDWMPNVMRCRQLRCLATEKDRDQVPQATAIQKGTHWKLVFHVKGILRAATVPPQHQLT